MILNIPERTKHRTLLLAIVVLLLSWLVGYVFLYYQFKSSTNEQINNITESTEKLFNIKLKEENKTLKLKLKMIVSADGLSEAIANDDFKKIDSIVTPYYNHLKSINPDIKILTFRSKDGTTLYRAHKPEFRGDSINKKENS